MKLLLTIKPVDSFTFSDGSAFADNSSGYYQDPGSSFIKKKESYIVKSDYFPQQTSIFGILRKQVLVWEKKLKPRKDYTEKDKQEIESLIGKKTFSFSDTTFDFGTIKNISQLFILGLKNGKPNCVLLPLPFDASLCESTYNPFKLENIEGYYVPLKDEFDYKKGLRTGFIKFELNDNNEFTDTKVSGKEIIQYDNILKKVFLPGNKKDKTPEEEDTFFIKERVFFNNKNLEDNSKNEITYVFAFTGEFTKDYKDKSDVVSIGLKNSLFNMRTAEIKPESFRLESIELENDPNEIYGKNKVVLMSDALLKDEWEKECNFSLVSPKVYVTASTNPNTYKLSLNANKYNLAKAGSVFYTKNKEDFIKNYISSSYEIIGLNKICK